jgi:tRNA(fMet)-specific endonuclease VapC
VADEIVLCDTSILSDLLRGGSRTTDMRDLLDSAIKGISVVTVAEMKWGALKAGWGQLRLEALEQRLRSYVQVGIDQATASVWAEIKMESTKAGSPKSDNDLWISATALRHNFIVASLDQDFIDIPRIRLLPESGVLQQN